jgi:protocatechuate 3,4-dioxygenase beta subunit
VQLTDASGVAEFRTIYPGFYQGRCPHIHVKVHVGGTSHGTTYSGGHVSYTGQLFFPEAASTQVYRHAPYTNDTNGRTRNSADHVYTQQHGSKSVLKLRRRGSLSQGFVGSAVVSIDPSATG